VGKSGREESRAAHRLKPELDEDLLKVEMETRIWGSGLCSIFKCSDFFPLPVLSILGNGALHRKGVGAGTQHLWAGGFGCTHSMFTHHLLSSKKFKSMVTHQQTIFPFRRGWVQNVI